MQTDTVISLVAIAVSAICGWGIPALVDLVTKATLPTYLKTLLAGALAALAGALTTVAFTADTSWQSYIIAIATAFVNTLAAHTTMKHGLGDVVQLRTANVGVGPKARSAPRKRAA